MNGSRKGKVRQNEYLTVGFLGRFSTEKNPLLFLEIAGKMQRNSNLEFIIGGEGPMSAQIEREVKKLSNTKNYGYVLDSRKFMEEVDVLVITSEVEGIPLVVMEALSLGIPVISTNVGGLSEILEDKKSGILWNGGISEIVAFLDDLTREREAQNFSACLNQKFWRSSTSPQVILRLNELIGAKDLI
jgi:glycosyltransferase involved in cell wall biosynthesis